MGRVPLRHQLASTECAAACLAMIAAFYGRDTRVAECREMLGIGRDGVSAAHLVAAAPRLGLQALAERRERLGPVGRPAIAYLTDHRFVVVEKAGARRVRLADPGGGRQWQSTKDFDRRFGGVLIQMLPGPEFVRRRTPVREWPMLRYLRDFVVMPGSRGLLAAVLACATVLKLLALVLPLATQQIVDTFALDRRADILPLFAGVVLGATVLAGLTTLLRETAVLALRVRAEATPARQLIRHVLRLPLSCFVQRRRGGLLARLGSVSTTRETVTQRLLILVLDAALLVGYLIGLAVLAPGYVPVVLALGAAHVLLVVRVFSRVAAVHQRGLSAKAEEQSYLTETLEAVVPVKADGVEGRAEQHWVGLFGTYRSALIVRGRITAGLEAFHQALTVAAPLLLLLTGLGLVLNGGMTIGTALAASTVGLAVLAPLQGLAGAGQSYPMLRSQIERVYDIVDADEEATGPVRLPAHTAGGVEVEDLVAREGTYRELFAHDAVTRQRAGALNA